MCRRVKEKPWAGGLGALSGEDEIWGQRWKQIFFSNYRRGGELRGSGGNAGRVSQLCLRLAATEAHPSPMAPRPDDGFKGTIPGL